MYFLSSLEDLGKLLQTTGINDRKHCVDKEREENKEAVDEDCWVLNGNLEGTMLATRYKFGVSQAKS